MNTCRFVWARYCINLFKIPGVLVSKIYLTVQYVGRASRRNRRDGVAMSEAWLQPAADARSRPERLARGHSGVIRVLAVFCNPKGTDALRLQAEQRILQKCLPPSVADLRIQPAATLDDLQQALMMSSFDVIVRKIRWPSIVGF